MRQSFSLGKPPYQSFYGSDRQELTTKR